MWYMSFLPASGCSGFKQMQSNAPVPALDPGVRFPQQVQLQELYPF